MITTTAFSIYWLLTGLIMLVPHFVFSLFLKKRKYYIVRVFTGVIAYALAAYLTCFTDHWNERYYLLLHLAGSLYLVLCCRCGIKMAIYFNIWCIALYYFVFQINAFTNALFGINESMEVIYIFKIIYLAVLVAISVFVIKSICSKDIYNLSTVQVVIAVLISASIIAFNSITFQFSVKQAGYTKYIFQIFSMLCNILVLYLQMAAIYSQRKDFENDFVMHLWRASKRDHELKAEYIDLINHKYHDLKHEIQALKQMNPENRDKHINKIEESIDQYGNLYQTENELLDCVLNDVRRHCLKENITFSCITNCKNIDFIDIFDLSILLGNMFDNAIDASMKLPEERRVIDVKLVTDEHYFRITEKNTFSGELDIKNGNLISSKQKSGYHGFGNQSMKYIVNKYNGDLALDAKNGIFLLYIIIPIPESITGNNRFLKDQNNKRDLNAGKLTHFT